GTLGAGTTLSNDNQPFVLEVSPAAALGDTMTVEFRLAGDPMLGEWADTISFVCGLPDGAAMADLNGSGGTLTLTNYGHLGVANASVLAAGGQGWTHALTHENCLYESSLMLISSDGGFADASRGSALECAPVDPVTVVTKTNGDVVGVASFDDRRSGSPLGVRVDQTVSMYGDAQVGHYAVIEFDIVNESGTLIPGMQIGYLVDFDIMSPNFDDEISVALPGNSGFYNWSVGSKDVAGVVSLGAPFETIHYYSNHENGKLDLSTNQKMDALLGPSNEPITEPGDVFAIVCSAPIDLKPSQTASFALVMVAAESETELSAAIGDAQRNWQQVTDVDDEDGDAGLVPRSYLRQNYPNPFNPETVIGYALGQAGPVRLDVYNLLGQHVRTLVNGWNPAGQNTVVWDGRDTDGTKLASGVYLYRLKTDNITETRKMVLMR
ncbi:MAG: T9SS type A sorting domain-containing protein, partial [candidate division Zixibacteria bacterium]|nr:T9SS type A sorting domain-containing protein [candidate division Zixibacteria bacterium]